MAITLCLVAFAVIVDDMIPFWYTLSLLSLLFLSPLFKKKKTIYDIATLMFSFVCCLLIKLFSFFVRLSDTNWRDAPNFFSGLIEDINSGLQYLVIYFRMPLFSGFGPWWFGGGVISFVSPHPERSPPCPLKHTRIQTSAMTHHSNNSVRDHMKWVSGSLFISRITIMVALICHPHCSTSPPSPPSFLVSLSLVGVLSPPPALTICSNVVFVLSGWVAGLRGGAVQYGPDAGQQHPRPEEGDVIIGSGSQVQSWEPPGPLTARPQPPRPPGSPRTRPPQSHGKPVGRELPTSGESHGSAPHWNARICVNVLDLSTMHDLNQLIWRGYGKENKCSELMALLIIPWMPFQQINFFLQVLVVMLTIRFFFFFLFSKKLIRKDGDYHSSRIIENKDMQANQNMQPKKKHKKSSHKVKEKVEVSVFPSPPWTQEQITFLCFSNFVVSMFVAYPAADCYGWWQLPESPEEFHLWSLLWSFPEQLPLEATYSHAHRWTLEDHLFTWVWPVCLVKLKP